jgi:hypothetical protein
MSAITLSLVALLVGAGIFLESPGVGIALAAIVVPLVAAVLLLGPAQSQQHIPASGGWISQALSVILAMTGLVVLVGGMLVAAAAVALFVFCSSFRL